MYKKIYKNVIVILMSGLMILSILTYISTRDIYINTVEDTLISNARLIANRIQTYEQLDNVNSISNIRELSALTNTRLTIIDKDGNVLYDSDKDSQSMENHIDRPEIIQALQNNTHREIRYSNTLNMDMMYIAVPLILDKDVAGVVRVSVALKDLKPILIKSLWNIFISIIFSMIVALILSHIIINNITKPLKETTIFAQEIAKGNYSGRLRMIRSDEIGDLSDSLNHMARQLEQSFIELSKRNSELESVLSNIDNGIIAIDQNEKIVLINSSAYKMFHLSDKMDVIGKNILEVIRTHELYQSMLELNISKETKYRTIETSIEERVYRITLNPIKESKVYKGFIIVIEDITQIRKLENIRRDFVANVSHELKTPITSIKGFIETLKEDSITDENTRNKFYNIIEFEVERLIRLVEDILTLSNLDSQPINNISIYDRVNISTELNNIFVLMENVANKKNISLEMDIEVGIREIPFNQKLFKQLMLNLIDNAIKYNRENGFVKVNIFHDKTNTIIEVSDNGYGIPERDLPRIFERFYRVDKGRSREAGGTGLGLAIVKHIVQIENCQLFVDSEYGKGTTFIIKVPER